MRIKLGDITNLHDVEVIVSPSNTKGLNNTSIPKSILDAGGEAMANSVMQICEKNSFKEGDCYISSSGKMSKHGTKFVYHAVITKHTGSPASFHFIGQCMRNVLNQAIANGVKSIAFPALGIETKALNPKQIASIMVGVAETYIDKIDISFVDTDKEFIKFAKLARKTEE